jgi:hypothetical protein
MYLMSNEQNDEECDATGDAMKNLPAGRQAVAGKQKLLKKVYE